MFLFVVYAIAVWYAAFRWRRTATAYAWVIAGILGLVGVAWVHAKLAQRWPNLFVISQLQLLLYPYTILVGVMGFFIASLPLSGCRLCGYDLSGHEGEDIERCPECGATTAEMRTRRGRRAARRRIRRAQKRARAPRVWSPASGEGVDPAEQEHERGDAKRHAPSERRQRAGVHRSDA